MKRFIALTLILALSMVTVAAQEDTEDMAGETAIVYIQDISSGTFVENDDETYTLTLTGLADEISFLQSLPSLDSGFMPTAMLFTGWGAAEDLSASETILRLEAGTITLTLSNPVYDPVEGTISYTVTAEEVNLEGSSKKGSGLPESFEEATLFVITDGDFASALEEGMSNAGLRGSDGP